MQSQLHAALLKRADAATQAVRIWLEHAALGQNSVEAGNTTESNMQNVNDLSSTNFSASAAVLMAAVEDALRVVDGQLAGMLHFQATVSFRPFSFFDQISLFLVAPSVKCFAKCLLFSIQILLASECGGHAVKFVAPHGMNQQQRQKHQELTT